MATVPNLTSQDFIKAADANAIRNVILNLLNQTDNTAYGVPAKSTAATADIQVATADHWLRLYNDVNSCYKHRSGTSIPGVLAPNSDNLITAAAINLIYEAAVDCVNTPYVVHPSQLELTEESEVFTAVVPWDNSAAYAYTWTWDTVLSAQWHFNLGGKHSFDLSVSSGTGSAADLALQQAVTASLSTINQEYEKAAWDASPLQIFSHTETTTVGDITIAVTYNKSVDGTTLTGTVQVTTPVGVSFNAALTGNFKTYRSFDALSATKPVTNELTKILTGPAGGYNFTLNAGSRSELITVQLNNDSPTESIVISNITATNAGATGFVVAATTDFSVSSAIVPVSLPLTVPAQGSVNVKVFYTRAVESVEGIGEFDNSIIVTSNSDLGVVSIPVTVTVTAPAFDFSLDLVDYDQPYSYTNWESNATRRNLGIAIANKFYLPNTDFGVINGYRRYGLYRKPDLASLEYWTAICSASYSSNPNSTAFTETFFNSVNPGTADFSRMLTNNKPFDSGWGYGDFYDQSLINVDLGNGSNKYYKYYIRPEFGTVVSYSSALSDYKFNNISVATDSSAARSFYVDNYMGSSLPPAVTQSPVTTAMANSSPIDGPRVRFDPFDVLSTGAYTATLTVTVTAKNLAGETISLAHDSVVTVNITALTNGNLLTWKSAYNQNNGVMGISYDRIDGNGYLTVGIGAGADNSPDVTNGGYVHANVNNLGIAGDSKYASGWPLYKMNSVAGWSNFMQTYGCWPVNPPPASTAAAVDLTTCISVIDEADDSGSVTDFYNRWVAFRNRFPYRPFYLLCANSSSAALNIPSNFTADPNAFVILVNRCGNNTGLRNDWFAQCNLGAALAGTRVLLSVDNSGSMTTSTVQASYDYFKSRIAASTLKLTEVTNPGEDWISAHNSNAVAIANQDPYIFDYINFYKFNVPADGNYTLSFQGTPNGQLYLDGVVQLTATGVNNAPVTQTVYLTSGVHQIGFKIPNIRNDILGKPNGVAIAVTRVNTGSIIWSTLEPVRESPPYIYWAEVYRFPLTYGVTQRLRASEHVIKHSRPMSNINGNRYTDFFGTPGTANAGDLLVLVHDGYGNLSFEWNSVGSSTGNSYHDLTMSGITELPYYYSFSNSRILVSNLEDMLPQQKTHKLVGVNPVEPVLAITKAPGVTATHTYTVPGVYSIVVPATASAMLVEVAGASGGGGGSDSYPGADGRAGNLLSGTISVTGGHTLQIYVGAGGRPGGAGRNAAGGAGGAGFRASVGGTGGNSGQSDGTSGSGGGGGGSSGIYNVTADTVLVVSGGGGGGGGGGNRSAGQTNFQSTPVAGNGPNGWTGGAGATHTGDGGGGGGGGAGYPGGSGGGRENGDYGGYSGQSGVDYGATYVGTYGQGGLGEVRGTRAGTAGSNGYVKISFSY